MKVCIIRFIGQVWEYDYVIKLIYVRTMMLPQIEYNFLENNKLNRKSFELSLWKKENGSMNA